MTVLDDINIIRTLDQSGMHESIKALPDQFKQTFDDTKDIHFDDSYKNTKNIVFAGMGGSALGAHSIFSVYSDKINVPFVIENGYDLPAFADENTLVILSSNSGNTEETLSCLAQAEKKGCKIAVITTGGKLGELKSKYPGYYFDQRFNKCGQPRMATGYMFLGTLFILKNIGIINLSNVEQDEILQSIYSLYDTANSNSIEVPSEQNAAKIFALELHGKFPIIITGEFLIGTSHTFANQINENAKQLSAWFPLSELNHHLLEGLSSEPNRKNVRFLIINSDLYSHRIRQRVELTKEIIETNGFESSIITVDGKNHFSQNINLLQICSYISFYMAILNNINPSPIPNVDYLKMKLNSMPW